MALLHLLLFFALLSCYYCSCLPCTAAAAAAAAAAKPLRLDGGGGGVEDDLLALIVFKSDLADSDGALESWNEDDESPCRWRGIACNAGGSGRVSALNLTGLALSGHIGRSLANLEFLDSIFLSGNNLSGSAAQAIRGLSQLRRLSALDLSRNKLSGSLDSLHLADFPSLARLDLSENDIHGPLPDAFFRGCNPSLASLSLSANSIQGAIPASIDSCANLRSLNLSANRLSGDLPDLASLYRLSSLDFSHNFLSGGLPRLGPNIARLHFQYNKLLGSVYGALDSFPLLQICDLSNNVLSGELPTSIGRSLLTLDLANNFLSGPIPSSWSSASSESPLLQVLNLSRNALDGEVPDALGGFGALQVVDLSQNRLSGGEAALRSLSSCAKLQILDLSSNILNAALPGSLPPNLQSLKLSDNQLQGQIPDSFASSSECAPSFRTLDLSLNRLQGPLPQSLLMSCGQLQYLNLSHNRLSGQIPGFGDNAAAVVIDLSHNRLTGSIPRSIGHATQLASLLLNANQLNGSIPSELGNCSSLRIIDLSHNGLDGDIPAELGNITGLEALDISHNGITGAIPAELGQLRGLERLDVSYNRLQGPIPGYGKLEERGVFEGSGNPGLCGAVVNVTCPSGGVMPKPIVLDPNATSADVGSDDGGGAGPLVLNPGRRRNRIVLSPSAIVAISAAAAIALGVAVVFLLNAYAQPHGPPAAAGGGGGGGSSRSSGISSFPLSPKPDTPSVGKLVMFSKSSDPRADEWIASAHALLNKDCEPLGGGALGTVYKAVLADGRTVAIKKLAASKPRREFEKEMERLGRMRRHRNVLALQGYYWTPQLQLLVYEYVANGSLYARLHDEGRAALPWPTRFRIAVGVGRALVHLHHGCDPPIVHYNVKSSNVLLDERDCPKLADYGLATLHHHPPAAAKLRTSLGYMPPELAAESSRISEKCDVYGFGVVLLELVTGRRPVEYAADDDVVVLVDHVRASLDAGQPLTCVDPALAAAAAIDDEALPVVKLGLICTSQVPSNRPSMAEVVQILELINTPANSNDLL